MRFSIVRAIFKRDFVGYFSSPTGYLFITVFIFLCAAGLFWQPDFFKNNLANLETLNEIFPVLLLFLVPAITMSAWADEKRQGVDELLLTLPARNADIVIGKYLASLGIYTVALGFSLSFLVILRWLGHPDWGLMFSNWLGYWLLGAALVAVGMVGSILTENLTVGFILGSVLCAIPVFCDERLAGGWLNFLKPVLQVTGADAHFRDLASGVLPLSALVYFATLAGTGLYLNLVLLDRKRWREPLLGLHVGLRAAAALVAGLSLVAITSRSSVRVDLTGERLHSLSQVTRDTVEQVKSDNPVYIQAYISPEVPRGYVEQRANLLNLLRQLSAIGGDRLRINVIETKPYSEEARRAEEQFEIRPVQLEDEVAGRTESAPVFLGVAVTCGADEVVTPFMYKNYSAEYELTRSIRTVSRPTGAAPAPAAPGGTDNPDAERAKPNRLKVGILETDARVTGGIDMQTFQQLPEWELVKELRRQYEVVAVSPDQAYPKDLALLIAILPSSLTEPQLRTLSKYVKDVKPVLILDDPVPTTIQGGSPQNRTKGPPPDRMAMMMGQQPPQQEQKGSVNELMTVAGIRWNTGDIIWDKYNPHPMFNYLPPEFVFLCPANGGREPINPNELTVRGMQELLFIFAGCIDPRGTPGVNFIPLLTAGKNSGIGPYEDYFTETPYGSIPKQNRKRTQANRDVVVAARTTGSANVIFIADIDFIGEQFFLIRRLGLSKKDSDQVQFDNVTFFLNCVDQLAGDESFIELRKRRRVHRTLDALELKTRAFTEQQMKDEQDALEKAEAEVKRAKDALLEEVRKINDRTDLDESQKIQVAEQKQAIEQKRFDDRNRQIEDEKERKIAESRATANREIEKIQTTVKTFGAILPPIPALLIGAIVWLLRFLRERGMAGGDRWVGGGNKS